MNTSEPASWKDTIACTLSYSIEFSVEYKLLIICDWLTAVLRGGLWLITVKRDLIWMSTSKLLMQLQKVCPVDFLIQLAIVNL